MAFGASLALVAGSAILYDLKRLGPQPRYPVFGEYQVAWSRLEALSPPEGIRIAYTGTGIPFYLMGSDLRNEVVYVNVDDHPGWLLHDYHLTAASRGDPVLWPSPRPAWDRLRPDRRAWLRNLERERINYLVVAGANPLEYSEGLDAEEFPIERQWAEVDPAHFVPVYGVNPPDPEMRIFRFRPQGATDRVPARH